MQKEVGVTRISLLNAEELIAKHGQPNMIQLKYTADDWAETTVTFSDGATHTFNGFGWGYGGEGPHGLAKFFAMAGFAETMRDIMSWSASVGFEKTLFRTAGEAPVTTEHITEDNERPSGKPLKAHAAIADEFIKIKKMQSELETQAKTLMAMALEKEKEAGAMAPELINIARQYKDATFHTKNVIIAIEEVPARKVKTPSWNQVVAYLLGKLEAISKDMRVEAERFIEDSKRIEPAKTSLRFQSTESVYLGERWAWLVKALATFKQWVAGIRNKAAALDAEANKLLAEL